MAATPLQTLLAGACCAAVLALCCTPNIGAQSTPPFSRATNAADGLTMQATEKIQQELAARIQAPRRVAASQAATFVENKGQWQGSALGTPRFLANLHRSGMAVWITDEGFVYDFFEPEQPLHAPDSIISPIDRRKWVANEVRRRASTPSTHHAVQMRFANTTQQSRAKGIQPKPGYYNYFLGNDSSKWVSNVPLWSDVMIENLYEGIAAHVYYDGRSIRYDMLVKPGANPSRVAFTLDGAEAVRLNERGELVMKTMFGEVLQGKLVAYQMIDGIKHEVPCTFTLTNTSPARATLAATSSTQPSTQPSQTPPNALPSVSFALGEYDRSKPLVIDPLVWATYVGGPANEDAIAYGQEMALDPAGAVYVTGIASDVNFAALTPRHNLFSAGSQHAFVTKLNPDGTHAFTTFCGGSGIEAYSVVDVDNTGRPYLAVTNNSTDFPMVSPFQGTNGGSDDVVITRLNNTGSAVEYSSYHGGSGFDRAWGIAVNKATSVAFVVGETESPNYPFVGFAPVGISGAADIMLVRVDAGGTRGMSRVIQSSAFDIARVVVRPGGDIVLVGRVDGTGFPSGFGITGPQAAFGGGAYDGFFVRIAASGFLLYGTYFGNASNEELFAVATDAAGACYAAGFTNGTTITTAGAFQTTFQGGASDAWVVKLNPVGGGAGDLLYATHIGTTGTDVGNAIAVDASGQAYVTGWVGSGSIAASPSALQTGYGGGAQDGFLAVLNAAGSALNYFTYLGGAGDDRGVGVQVQGANIHLAVETTGIPSIAACAPQPSVAGAKDYFVTKFTTAPATTFVYVSGDAALPSSWRTDPLCGQAAASFGAGQTFVVPAAVTASMLSNLTLPVGATLQVNGTLNLNGRNLVIDGALSLDAAGALQGNNVSNLTFGTASTLIGNLRFTGTTPHLNTFTYNRTPASTITLGTPLETAGAFALSNVTTLNLNGQSLTVGGVSTLPAGALIRGNAASNLTLNGAVTGTLAFDAGFQTLNNATFAAGTVALGSPLSLFGNLTLGATSVLNLNGQSLTVGGTTSAPAGSLWRGSAASNLTLNGSVTGNLTFDAGFQTLNNLSVNGAATSLGSALTVGGAFNLNAVSVLALNGQSLTLNGASNLAGQFSGGGASSLFIAGAVTNPLRFSAMPTLQDFSFTNGSTLQLGSALTTITNSFLLGGSSVLDLNNRDLTLNGTSTITAGGQLRGSAASDLVINGAVVGVVNFQAGGQTLNTFTFTNASTFNCGTNLDVLGNFTLAPVSTFNINTNTLTINGTTTIGANLNGFSGTGSLIFNGPVANPLTFNGAAGNFTNVSFTHASTFTLGEPLNVNGTFTLAAGAICALNGQTLTLNGPSLLNGQFAGTAASNLTLNSPVTGTLNFQAGAQDLGTFTVAAGIGNIVQLASPLAVNTSLVLGTGIVQPTSSANPLTVASPVAGAISGGSANAFVAGPLRRRLTIGGASYLYPMGKGTSYLPVTLTSPAGGGTPEVEFEATNTGSSGSPNIDITTLSATEFWRGRMTMPGLTSALLEFRPTAIQPSSVLGSSAMQAGMYNGVQTTVSAPTLQTALPFTGLSGADTFFTTGNAPVPAITLLAPNSTVATPFGLMLTITGTNLRPFGLPLNGTTTLLTFNGQNVTPFISSHSATTIVVTLPPGALVNPATVPVQVATIGGPSAPSPFTISPVATYTYISGDAGISANWNSMPDGTGLPAANFLLNGATFVMPAGTTGLASRGFELGTNVTMNINGNLTLSDTVGIVNNGTINVGSAGTLELRSSAVISGRGIMYASTTSTLQYSGTTPRTTSNTEFPSPANFAVVVTNRGGVLLNESKALNGSLTLAAGGFLNLNGRTLITNAPLSNGGGVVNVTPNSNLITNGSAVLSSGTLALTGGAMTLNGLVDWGGVNVLVQNNSSMSLNSVGTANPPTLGLFRSNVPLSFRDLTVNRANLVLPLPQPASVSGVLTLARGIVTTTMSNTLTITNPDSAAIVGASPVSHVRGALRRVLADGLSGDGGVYHFPIAKDSVFMPFALVAPATATGSQPLVDVELFTQDAGGRVGDSLVGMSTTEYWRARVASGGISSTQVQLTRFGLTPNSRVGATTGTLTGRYNSIGGTLSGSNLTSRRTALPSSGDVFYLVGSIGFPPIISAFTPAASGSNATVTITGEHFDGITQVLFGGTAAASFMVRSTTSIVATVGGGSTGAITIRSFAGSTTASGFTFIPPPIVTSVSPTTGTVGQVITIRGEGLGNASRVLFGTTSVGFTVNSTTQITAVAVPNTSGFITVQTPGGRFVAATNSNLRFYMPIAPTITNVSPLQAAAGTRVVVRGMNFEFVQSVSIGGVAPAAWRVISPTEIEVIVGNNTPNGTVRVQTLGGSVTSVQTFTFAGTPAITALSVTEATVGTSVIITGEQFVGVERVLFGSVTAAVVTVSSATQLIAVIPPNVAANQAVNVTVITAGGRAVSTNTTNGTASAGNPSRITIVAQPVVSEFRPQTASVGGTVVIRGANFVGATQVLFGGVPAQRFQVDSAGQITAVLSRNGTTGTITVVNVAGSGESSAKFQYSNPPTIDDFTPRSGGAGTVVTITGQNLDRVRTVLFGTVPAQQFMLSTTNQIFATVADGASGAITFVFADGRISSDSIFTFIGPPLITDFSPPQGGVGDSVAIRGQNFVNVREVSIGGARTAFRVVSPSEIVIVLAANPTSGTIRVTTPFGTGISALSFRALTPFEQDSLALLDLYRLTMGSAAVSTSGSVTTGTGWIARGNWGSGVSITQWQGVRVVGGRVVSLQLPNNNITGSLASSFGALTALQVLDLSGNRLSGAIPPTLRAMVNLQELRLGGNRLSGALLELTAGMRNLRVLSVENNNFVGRIPEEFCFLQNLREINLANNRFVGEIPSCVTALTNAVLIDLSRNLFTGQLPADIGRLANLQVFNVAHNGLTGGIPRSLGVNTLANTVAQKRDVRAAAAMQLVVLDVSNNRLSGALPAELANISSLRTLHLSNNGFTGTVPTEWKTLQLLERLDVSGNALSGRLPTELGELQSLTVLDVGANRFTGTVPPSFGNLVNVTTLSLRANTLQDSLPSALGRLRNVQVLRLDSNRFSGALPNTFRALGQLKTVDLSNNQLTFIGALLSQDSLNELHIARNRLTYESLEPYLRTNILTYAPQDSLGRRIDTTLLGNTLVRLEARAGGSRFNRYQWFRNGVTMGRTATDSALVFESFAPTDAGTYTCRVSNQLVADMDLHTRPVTLRYQAPPPPAQGPDIVFPQVGAVNIAPFPTLTWTAVAGAALYEVEMSLMPDFAVLFTTASVRIQRVRIEPLQRQTRYYWRVRAVNDGGRSQWSRTGSFTTVERAAELALSSVDFGKVAVGEVAIQSAEIANLTATPVTITQMRTINDTDREFNAPLAARTITVLARQTRSVELEFIPRNEGNKRADVEVRYIPAGQAQPLLSTFANAVSGRGSALKIVEAKFDTVLVDRPALVTSLILNKGTRSARILEARVVFGNELFTTEAVNAAERFVAPGDTTTILVRCVATAPGAIAGTIRLITDIDTVEAPINAIARVKENDDIVVRLGLRAERDTVEPGNKVNLQLYIASSTDPLNVVYRAMQPFFRGSFRFDRNVLMLTPVENEAIAVRNRDSRDRLQRAIIPPTRWTDAQDSVLARFPCLVVNGDTNVTALQIEEIDWGGLWDPAIAARGYLRKIFFDGYVGGQFVAGVCAADGLRLFTKAGSSARLLARSSPNPTSDELTVAYSTKEHGSISLALFDQLGRRVRTIVQGETVPGDYTVKVNTSNLPAGAYTLLLQTPSGLYQERVVIER